MKVKMNEFDPARLTVDEAEALRDAGLELFMAPDRKIIALMEIGDMLPEMQPDL